VYCCTVTVTPCSIVGDCFESMARTAVKLYNINQCVMQSASRAAALCANCMTWPGAQDIMLSANVAALLQETVPCSMEASHARSASDAEELSGSDAEDELDLVEDASDEDDEAAARPRAASRKRAALPVRPCYKSVTQSQCSDDKAVKRPPCCRASGT